jgi:DeoR/GlpR family transcriptional regulator of sugar metabolism
MQHESNGHEPENGNRAEAMMAEERRTQILQIIREHGKVRVNELTERFKTSAVTIRGDLRELHSRGLVLRSHGGAVAPDAVSPESPLQERSQLHAQEKRRIGAAAAALVHDGETIILDSGTTTQEIAKNLRGKQNLQVITNGVNVAMELLGVRGIQLIIVGGILRDDSVSVVGRFAEDMLQQFSADKLFLGAAGCDPEFGASTPNPDEALVNQTMVRIAREVILIADSSKFDKRCLSRIAPFTEIDKVVTDRNLPEDVQSQVRAKGCEIILA